MARTREMIRDLFLLILQDAAETARRHICAESMKYGSCVVCASGSVKYVFIHTAVLRQLGLLDPELIESEQLLLDILGEKRYNNILREQLRTFMSGPAKKCAECGAKVKMLESYTDAWSRMQRAGPLSYYCPNCGARVQFDHHEFPRSRRRTKKIAKKGLIVDTLEKTLTLGKIPTQAKKEINYTYRAYVDHDGTATNTAAVEWGTMYNKTDGT